MTLEEAILQKVRSLPIGEQQELLRFAEVLVQRTHGAERKWSSEFLSTFGAWEGELERAPQEEPTERMPFE
ncbi:MAG: hypothetical protein B0A82_16630 [Alkalinema sp. CACIAM 70d]|nr:MAG: hypothetical protein B0A82_16630 [Alkalinema sp. CACIAM 70d]